jgi:DNA-binding NarL/FixJ family response regulator
MTNPIVKMENVRCVVLADRHQGLMEGVRGLLETAFDAVVMVADEASLMESAKRIQPTVAVVDLSMAPGANFQWLKRLRTACPDLKLIVLSVHDEPNICQSVMAAGADGFVIKREIGTELLPAVDTVLAGRQFISRHLATGKPSK